MAVESTTFIRDATLFIRDLIATVTDPISTTRGSKSKFVATAYPERFTEYPMITVICDNISGDRDGMRSEGMNLSLDFEIRVWSKSTKQRDTLSQDVLTTLRTKQIDASTGSIANNLFGFSLGSAVNVDEPGENGIHSRVMSISYQVFIDG